MVCMDSEKLIDPISYINIVEKKEREEDHGGTHVRSGGDLEGC